MPRRLDAGRPDDETMDSVGREPAAGCTAPGQRQIPQPAGQREDHLVKAMRDYRDGSRGGFDGTMSDVLHGVSDRDLLGLAHELSHRR